MLAKPSDKLKKTELFVHKNSGTTAKRSLMQSQEFGSVRRHSVYGNDFEQITVRVSSKEMKSLPKYKQQRDNSHPDKRSLEKAKGHHQEDKLSFDKLFLHRKAYRYLNMIGKGGFGKVWKVEHLGTGRLYAMK